MKAQRSPPAKPIHRSRHGRLRVAGAGDVEPGRQEIVVRSDGGCDLRGVTSGSDNRVTGSQGGLGNVDTHAPARAGDEPNLLVTHAGALLLPDPQVVPGTASSAVHCYTTTRRTHLGAPDDGATDRDPLPQRIPSSVEAMAPP